MSVVSLEAKVNELSDVVQSLDRAIRGAEEEGNRGLLGRVQDHGVRISTLERQWTVFQSKVAGAAAVGGAIGSILTLAFTWWTATNGG